METPVFRDYCDIAHKPKEENMQKLMNTKQLAEYLGIAVSTILQYRADGTGPQYIKLGHLVRYRQSDVDAWLERKSTGKN